MSRPVGAAPKPATHPKPLTPIESTYLRNDSNYASLKLDAEMKSVEERRTQERRRNLIILILGKLQDFGFANTAFRDCHFITAIAGISILSPSLSRSQVSASQSMKLLIILIYLRCCASTKTILSFGFRGDRSLCGKSAAAWMRHHVCWFDDQAMLTHPFIRSCAFPFQLRYAPILPPGRCVH